MGYLKKLFSDIIHNESIPVGESGFKSLSEDQLEAHMGISRYGDFELTKAVRPSYDVRVCPREGYMHTAYHDEESHERIPVLMAAATKEHLKNTTSKSPLFLWGLFCVFDDVISLLFLPFSSVFLFSGHNDPMREVAYVSCRDSTMRRGYAVAACSFRCPCTEPSDAPIDP